MLKGIIAIVGVVALTVATGIVIAVIRTPRPVTADPSPATQQLFDALRAQQGQGIRFGQQLALTVNVSGEPDIGATPAIVGWDTLAFSGAEPPSSFEGVVQGVIEADRLGAVSTLSMHLPNLVTGGDYSDTSGDAPATLLADPAPLNAYLDQIAALAERSVDASGELIPIIFRPFHEGTGDWFWWGGADASALYRHAVTYLRDEKGVTNLLYTWSPNGPFDGDADAYLATYPGDDVVDILGLDFYESDNSADNSDDYIAQLVADLAMVARTADAHGKIAALTEFGRNGDRSLRPGGNRSLTFFTDLLSAVKADPDARRVAYAMTWANFGQEQFYVPHPGHEMAGDFADFVGDEWIELATPE